MEELVKRLWECASGECFNCSQYRPTTNASVCQKELMKQAADAIEDLESKLNLWRQDKISRWIPVTKRLPSAHELVLVYKPGYLMTVGFLYEDGRWRVKSVDYPETPTHWMPLPEPPKEE